MTKNIFYRETQARRVNFHRKARTTIMGMSSPFMLLIEVFIRKNMGERYFNLTAAVVLGLLLFCIPFFMPITMTRDYWTDTLRDFWSIYVYLGFYSYFTWKRYKETLRPEGQFHMDRLSTSSGDILPFFLKSIRKGQPNNQRNIEIYSEPGAVMTIAVILFLLRQDVMALILFFVAIDYSNYYILAYQEADDMILDMIDARITSRMIDALLRGDTRPNTQLRFSTMPSLNLLRDLAGKGKKKEEGEQHWEEEDDEEDEDKEEDLVH